MADFPETADPLLVSHPRIQDDAVSAVQEFLEACIHQILQARALYKPALFERRRLYNIVVSASRHPGLNKYISGVMESLKEALLRSELDRIVIALTTETGEAVEQFVIDMPMTMSAMTMRDVGELEALFRSTLLRLQNCGAILEPIPPGFQMRQGPVDIDKRLRGLVTGRATGGMEVALVASAATVFMPGKALGVAIRQVARRMETDAKFAWSHGRCSKIQTA